MMAKAEICEYWYNSAQISKDDHPTINTPTIDRRLDTLKESFPEAAKHAIPKDIIKFKASIKVNSDACSVKQN